MVWGRGLWRLPASFFGHVDSNWLVFRGLLRPVLAPRWGPLLMAPIFAFLWLFFWSVLGSFGGRLVFSLVWEIALARTTRAHHRSGSSGGVVWEVVWEVALARTTKGHHRSGSSGRILKLNYMVLGHYQGHPDTVTKTPDFVFGKIDERIRIK